MALVWNDETGGFDVVPPPAPAEAPPHLEHEWAALTRSEQRDVLRWAAQVVRQDAQHVLREPRPWINTDLCRQMQDGTATPWCVAHGMPYPHDV